MPLDCLISLNVKIEDLCGLLYEIGFILLQGKNEIITRRISAGARYYCYS